VIVLGLYLARWQAPAILAGYEFFLVEDSTNLPVYFLAGSLLCVIPTLQDRRAIATAVALGAVFAVAGFPGLAWVAIAPFIVLGVARRSWPFLRHASRFGDLSYGIYLWAWPVQQIVIMVLGKEAPLSVLLSVSLAAITGLAFMSWHLVERPALGLKPSRSPR
jgi:peptidoglycan/LPS O-acetylase OafA/YrhL